MNGQRLEIFSLVIAVLSAATSVFFSIRARRDVKIQRRMEIIALKRQYYSALQKWADDVVDTMTETIFLCLLQDKLGNGDFFTKRHSARAKLSALIDRGRWFIPNELLDQYGKDKPKAFRGFRPPALNYIVNYYDILKKIGDNSYEANRPLRETLWTTRKQFVSEIQDILDPREREKETRDLMS